MRVMVTSIDMSSQQSWRAPAEVRELYLDLTKRCLTSWIYPDGDTYLGAARPFDPQARREGRDWPKQAHTMIGLARLDNLQYCVEDVLARGIPGDLLEAGVWRGGATIFMRAILNAYGVRDRRVWVADSFRGLPAPGGAYLQAGMVDGLHTYAELAVPLEQVQANFARYGLLDKCVCFLPGWFRDTLPTAAVDALAVLRLDADRYESTMEALVHLYPKLARGGYVIVDDYGAFSPCRAAVHEYREAHGITDRMIAIDWSGTYWRRT